MSAEFAIEAAGVRVSRKDKRNPCGQVEAQELYVMRWDRTVPVTYPFPFLLKRFSNVAIDVGPGAAREARQHRKDAVERVEANEHIVRRMNGGLSERAAIRSAAIELGIEASSLRGAEDKTRRYWKSRPHDRTREFQLKACEADRRRVVEYIAEIVRQGEAEGSDWSRRWATDSDGMLRNKIVIDARALRIGEQQLRRWTGRSPAEWDRPTMLVVLRAICAVFTFAILNVRIGADYRRMLYGLKCAEVYFHERNEAVKHTYPVKNSLACAMKFSDEPEVIDLFIDLATLEHLSNPNAIIPGLTIERVKRPARVRV